MLYNRLQELWANEPAVEELMVKVQKELTSSAVIYDLLFGYKVQVINPFFPLFISLFIARFVVILWRWATIRVYRPAFLRSTSSFNKDNVTVILTTQDPELERFPTAAMSILQTYPAALLIVTPAGPASVAVQQMAQIFRESFPTISIGCSSLSTSNKRAQIAHAARKVTTSIVVLADDHVVWPWNLYRRLLAPFDDELVAAVSVERRVRRCLQRWNPASLYNFISCLFVLSRANQAKHDDDSAAYLPFDLGLTAAYRTSFLHERGVLSRFCHQRCLWPFGPFEAGAETFLAREAVAAGWKVTFQSARDADIEVESVQQPHFLAHLAQDARVQVRASLSMALRPRFSKAHPWSCVLAFAHFVSDISLLWDGLFIWSFWKSGLCYLRDNRTINQDLSGKMLCVLLIVVILAKVFMVKRHFLHFKTDIFFFPIYILFGWLYSFIKLWGLLTFWRGDSLDEHLSNKNPSYFGDSTAWLPSGTWDYGRVGTGRAQSE